MKLTLSHNDVISGICAFLAERGLTGFDPSKVQAEFTKGRDGKLSVVLDDEAVASETAPKEAKPRKPKVEGGTAEVVQTTDAAGADVQKELAPADKVDTAAAEVPANGPVTTEQAASQEVVEEAATATETADQPAGEENLFG